MTLKARSLNFIFLSGQPLHIGRRQCVPNYKALKRNLGENKQESTKMAWALGCRTVS